MNVYVPVSHSPCCTDAVWEHDYWYQVSLGYVSLKRPIPGYFVLSSICRYCRHDNILALLLGVSNSPTTQKRSVVHRGTMGVDQSWLRYAPGLDADDQLNEVQVACGLLSPPPILRSSVSLLSIMSVMAISGNDDARNINHR